MSAKFATDIEFFNAVLPEPNYWCTEMRLLTDWQGWILSHWWRRWRRYLTINRVLDRKGVSHYTGLMGRGLSPLQHDILAAIKAKRGWLRSKEIREAIGREPTDSNSVAVSKALGRLCKRGLIERSNSKIMHVGKLYLYRWPRKP